MKPIAPRWVIRTMIVVASILAIGATMNSWAERQLLDTNTWVNLSDQMLEDPDVREALSLYLVDQVYDNVDVAAELEARLPEDWQRIAGPLAGALRQPATAGVDRLLETAQAREIWSRVNRVAHERAVNILRDETTVAGTSTADGTLTVNLSELVTAVAERLGLPTALVDKIPEDAGQIVLLQSDALSTAQTAVRLVEVASVVLFIVVVALYAGAVYLARGRRRETLRNVGWALVASGFVVLLLRRISVRAVVDEYDGPSSYAAGVESIANIATSLLSELAWIGIILGVLIAAYAVLTGPSRAAVAVRRELAPVLANALTIWVIAIGVVLVYFAIRPTVSFQNWLPRVVVFILFVTGVELLRRQVRREHPDASIADSWHRLSEGFRARWNA